MPVSIPVTAAGERVASVHVGPEVLQFRTYYVQGQDRRWLLDISAADGTPLAAGVALIPGVDNLLKGRGDTLEGCQLSVRLTRGTERDPDAPGNGMQLVWHNPGEKNPDEPADPMETIGQDVLW